MNLTIMYRDMHRFIVNISELRWILTEANLLMKRFETIQSHTGND